MSTDSNKPPEEYMLLENVLRNHEYPDIKNRRKAAGIPCGDVPTDLVGLALSGGGVRSSMFNLGVLQGIHSTGMLRHVDYLVTVSGGGFIGGFLTSQLNLVNQRLKTDENSVDRVSHACKPSHPLYSRFPLRPEPHGQSSAVVNLTRNGNYLNAPFDLALRVVCGVVLHLLIVVTAMIAVCALLALLWRIPDMVDWRIANMIDMGNWTANWICWLALWLLLLTISVWLARRVEALEKRYFVTGSSQRVFWTVIFWMSIAAAALTLSYSNPDGFPGFYRDWYYSSDVVRALVPLMLVTIIVRFAWLRGRWKSLSEWDQNRNALMQENSQGSENRSSQENPIGPAGSGRQRLWEKAWTFLNRRAPQIMVGAVGMSLLTMFANGDTDLGYGLGRLIGRFLPGVVSDQGHYKSYIFHIRNNRPIADWLGKITQVLLFLQILSGVLPLLLPRQFVLSGQAPSSSPKGVLYRFVVLMLMGSVPVLLTYLLLRENISRVLPIDGQVIPPIRRLEVCRDPWSSTYANLITHDQWARARWCLLGLCGFLLLNGCVDLNRTSLHLFYRERLKRAYFGVFAGTKNDPTESDRRYETRLSEIQIDRTGAPYHLVAATMAEIRPGEQRLDVGCSFVFAPRCSGWVRHHPLRADAPTDPSGTVPFLSTERFVETTQFGGPPRQANPAKHHPGEERGLRLVDALAISGAAISPTQAQSLVDSIVLLTVNARLGQWLPNPARPIDNRYFEIARAARHGIPKITTSELLIHAWKDPEKRKCCFLTDGAHHDNLGLEPLFDRRCRLIILSDASHDPNYTFSDLSKVLRRLQAHCGIRFWLAARLPEPTKSPDITKQQHDKQKDKRSRTRFAYSQPTAKVVTADTDDGQSTPRQGDDGSVGENQEVFEPGDFRVVDNATAAQRKWSFFGDPPSASDLKNRLCMAHHIVFGFRYPPHESGEHDGHGQDTGDAKDEGVLVVLKPSLTGDEDRFSPGLLSYARAQAEFPMDPDLRQSFDESQCEFYRMLGVHVARCIFRPNAQDGRKFRSPEDKENAQRQQHEVFDRIAACVPEEHEFEQSLWCRAPQDPDMIRRYGIEDFREGFTSDPERFTLEELLVRMKGMVRQSAEEIFRDAKNGPGHHT